MSMKTNLIINLFLVVHLFTSCHVYEKYENASLFSLTDFKTTTKLNATTVEFDEPIMLPVSFVKSDSLLIVQNIRTKNMLYVYNINSRKKVGEFISFGSGPDELLRIKNMQLVGKDLYITDSQKKSVNKYDINDFHKITDNLVPIQKIAIEDFFYHLAYTDNGYVAIAMNPENKRLMYYNSKGEREFTAGEYPYFGKELTVFENIEGFNSFIVISHQYKRIYLFGMATDLIEIYGFNGELVKRLHGPDQVFPQVKEVRSTDGYSRMSGLGKSTFTFSHPIIIGDEIYVAYSGHQIIGEESYPIMNHILVFDLECNPVRRYELSKSIVAFTIDPETKKIYATSNIPEYHMVVFD